MNRSVAVMVMGALVTPSIERYAVLLLLTATVIAIVTRRLRLPYSVGLLAAGMGLALLPFAPRIRLTRDLIFTGLLPPLLFEAAFYLSWSELRRELPVVGVLATGGVGIAAAVASVGMHFAAGWSWAGSLVFGTLIAATDPVSVIAIFREAKVGGRLRLLLESESLFNDGTAAVAFVLALSYASGQALSPAKLILNGLFTAGGGVLLGAIAGSLVLVLLVNTDDHLVETAATTVAAWGSFLLADTLNFSGVFATITAGLIVGNRANAGVLSQRGREAVQGFWEYAAFIANSIIFLLIGMQETDGHWMGTWLPATIAVVFVTLGRAATVYPLSLFFRKTSLRLSWAHQHVLFWGGLRGALALALVLGLPENMPMREEILGVSFAVVAFSIFVQGVTVRPLLRRLGEIPGAHESSPAAQPSTETV